MTHNKQPGSKMCFVCGQENPFGLKLDFYETTSGEVTVDYIAPDHFQGYPGMLHGGIAATILDEVAGRAHIGNNPPRFMYTAKLEIKYRKNVPVGQPLTIIGKAGKDRGRMAEGWAGIYDNEGKLLVEANALLVNLPEEALGSANLEELGWKVYPDKE
ncbi:MAG: PaaI family thioesterase [Anaerolineae bacterium]|jgi:acyl-coenzyme A thioesterase PaaI-like protein|nr:PaaI family thioesterase [Anaerolineae bacterium]MBT7070633.1 PaaI family thioesterase [Anaerolineae bacterium]MBT7326261.1 PaaI family thioesterase [Anaerolineae bacterium]MBT7602605.1 PaaI family thioesterase [Anaerolineae bacterium]